MEIQNQMPQNIEQAIEEYERCNYQLNTLFDFSKDIFGILDIEAILRNSLLFTMGNFGVVDGFLGLFDLDSEKKIQFVSEGHQDFDLEELEKKVRIKEGSRSIGVTMRDLARQIRQAFYGEEALRIQRDRDDVKVMVRYADKERHSLAGIEEMRIRTADGQEIPIEEVADITPGRAYSVINRVDRKRTITVISDIDSAIANASVITGELKSNFLPGLLERYPGIIYDFEGQEKRTRESLDSIKSGYLLAMMGIFLLLASQFRSYIQPVIIMMAIPFGLIGAVFGHLIMGMEFTIVSIFGIVALSGIVVNDSLILIDFISRTLRSGAEVNRAVSESGMARFRPVLLTSVTTIAGLFPLLLERSFQAQFLIPMAISLGFGVLFSTFVTLLLIPCGFMILEDIHNFVGGIRTRPVSDQTG